MDLLREISIIAPGSEGEPETCWIGARQIRSLSKDVNRPEYWFEKGRYTQLDFPKADDPFKGKAKKGVQQFKVIKKLINVDDSYSDLAGSWDKFGDKDYSTDFESSDKEKGKDD